MTLNERIEADYLAAYKAHETDKVGVLRLLKAAIKNHLVELKRPGGSLDDSEMLEVILKQAKQRTDSIEQYTNAGRKDLADKEAAELEILKSWLPKALTRKELEQVIKDIVSTVNATCPKDMGKVMKELTSKYTGQIDNKEASKLVREMLSAK